MRKNQPGQHIGAQMVSRLDGSAFTGAVTVEITGDAGTQATGTVGSGACTHEGNGYHTYAPAQAETNFDLIAFTFVGTDAIPQTIQVFTQPNAADILSALFDTADTIETGVTFRGGMRLMLAALAGKLSGANTSTTTIRNAVADTKDRIVATTDATGRTNVTTDQT